MASTLKFGKALKMVPLIISWRQVCDSEVSRQAAATSQQICRLDRLLFTRDCVDRVRWPRRNLGVDIECVGLRGVHGPGRFHLPWETDFLIEGGNICVVRPNQIPTATWTFQLKQVEKIVIYGPIGRRRWHVVLKDGDDVDIPPVGLMRLDRALTAFMQTQASKHLHVELKSPPTMFDEIRGDFDWED